MNNDLLEFDFSADERKDDIVPIAPVVVVEVLPAVHSERAHALIAPSGTGWKCAASIWETKDLPESTSVFAEEGTLAHEWSEQLGTLLLINNDTAGYVALLKHFQSLDEEMAEYCQKYVSHNRHVFDELVRVKKPKSISQYIEQRVYVFDETYGTADYVIVAQLEDDSYIVVVVDLKYGKGVKVDPENNNQLKLYLLGAIKTLLPVDAVVSAGHAFIYQPRIDEDNPWLKARYTGEQLKTEEKILLTTHNRILEILRDGPTISDYTVGDGCRFCRALPTCVAYRAYHSEHTQLVLEESIPETLAPSDSILDRVIATVKAKKSIERFLRDCEHYLMTQMQQGKTVADYKLVASRSQRRWKPELTDLISTELTKLGCKEPFEKKLIGITKAKKFISDKQMEPFVEKTASKLQLALITDPRPEVAMIDCQTLLIDEGEE